MALYFGDFRNFYHVVPRPRAGPEWGRAVFRVGTARSLTRGMPERYVYTGTVRNPARVVVSPSAYLQVRQQSALHG